VAATGHLADSATLHRPNGRVAGVSDFYRRNVARAWRAWRSPEWHGRRQFRAWDFEVSTQNTFLMIWVGVGGPGDSVAPLNRFPPHNQRVTAAIKRRFVAKSHQLGTAARRSGKSSARNIGLAKVAWERIIRSLNRLWTKSALPGDCYTCSSLCVYDRIAVPYF
jgi:hypothetical protein